MSLSGSSAVKKATRLITDFSNITQDDPEEANPEAAELDLGTKIKAPKEVMLEELSLLKNKGSRMFKMRQQRVERFIYENNPEKLGEQPVQISNNLMSPLLGGMENVRPEPVSTNKAETEVKEDAAGEQDGGGALEEKHVKTYVSPWERAMRGDEELLATMKPRMPGPHVHRDPPPLKSFNRTAQPFGDAEKTSTFTELQPPALAPPKQPEVLAAVRDISLRPSFNRTPVGWVCGTEPGRIHVDTDIGALDTREEDL
ncbi:myozenin-1-like isoform X2 [Scleropages formosus]|nr:myozenin-1-like isoform X2 [Scleropages formosus]